MATRVALAVAVFGRLVTRTLADLTMTGIADACADTNGFNTCWGTALDNAKACYQRNCQGEGTCDDENNCTSGNANCVEACSCVAYEEMISCSLTYCWNAVNTCEYQNLAISAVEFCPVALGANNPWIGSGTGWVWIPYFPTDPSVTDQGACSCDISFVYLEQLAAATAHTACYNNANSNSANLFACDCCQESSQVSVFYNTCPKTNPQAVLGDMPRFPLGNYEMSSRCATVPDCHGLGFAIPGPGGIYYSPSNVPGNGSEALSDANGDVASPLYPTLTWQLGNGLAAYTVVAAAAVSGGSGSGAGGSSSIPTTSGTGSTSTSSSGVSPTKTGAASKIGGGYSGIGTGVLIAITGSYFGFPAWL